MAITADISEPERTIFSCSRCNDKGLAYEGSGHRMLGYPFAEKTVLASCNCAAGVRLDLLEKGTLERERSAQSIADDLMAQVLQ